MCRALSPEVTVFAPSPLFPVGITARSCCSFNFLAIRVKLLLTNCSKALHRQRKNIADAALGLDHAWRAGVAFKLAPQPQNLHVNASVEDVLVDTRRLQQVLAAKWALWCIEECDE